VECEKKFDFVNDFESLNNGSLAQTRHMFTYQVIGEALHFLRARFGSDTPFAKETLSFFNRAFGDYYPVIIDENRPCK
jgi:hypothetical protein